MKIISANLNGIRAAARKGFFEWLPQQDADVICIQETKAQLHQLEGDPQYFPEGYHCYYYDSTVKKGYSGTAIYSRVKPDEVIRGMGHEEFDGEGRCIEAQFGKLSVVSLYAPSGSSGEHRQASKDRYLEHFLPFLKEKIASREMVVCGDYNIAHQEIDLKNWKGNKKNSGFLPHERDWMTQLFDEVGYRDAFRVLEPELAKYTWWSNRGQARANDVGWRIDYHVISKGLTPTAESVYKDSWFSDHAPLIIEYSESIEDFKA